MAARYIAEVRTAFVAMQVEQDLRQRVMAARETKAP
jgi:hypothetical protein